MAYAWTHEFLASYEQAQSRLRLSMTCRALVRPLDYPLPWRIVEWALLAQAMQPNTGENRR